MLRTDGSIQSANAVRSYEGEAEYRLFRCQVTRVLYVDDPLNIMGKSKYPQVLYECIIVGGEFDGHILSNCRDFTRRLGSETHYEERILQASPKKMNLQSPDSAEPKDQPGDMVLVGLVNGNYNLPAIVGFENSPLDDGNTGCTAADGPRWIWGYNGVTWEIDNSGDLTITRQGGALDTTMSVFAPAVQGNAATFQLTGNQILLNVKEGGTQIILDGDTDELTVMTAAGAVVTISGSADQVKLLTKGGAEINLSDGTIAIGASGTELLEQISQTLSDISTWATSTGAVHTHTSAAPGSPTTPPLQAAGYTSLGSQLSSIQSMIDSIKGSL